MVVWDAGLSHKTVHRERLDESHRSPSGGWRSSGLANDRCVFHFREGKIVERWVNRDELGMLIELGVLASAMESK